MSNPLSLKPNPGGQLAIDAILGRDPLIDRMWEILEGHSIYMNDVRRIGKTQIMVKMHAQPRPDWTTVKTDLGGIHTAEEFATEVYRHSLEILGKKKKMLRKMQALLGSVGGTEIAGVLKLPNGTFAPWQEVLRRTFTDVDDAIGELGPNHRILYLWDEVPFMLDNIAKRKGPAVAMEVLDLLRALSQDHDRIRFVLTGSIGIHHVLTDLRQDGYGGSPLNRMELVQPGPLHPDDATTLAQALLNGGSLTCDDPTACARAIAHAAGNVAFYIHKLVSRLPRNTSVTPEIVAKTLRAEITNANNDWDLEHYRTRIDRYYRDNVAPVLAILDALAIGGPLPFAEIRKQVNAQTAIDDERLRRLLKMLCQDHYLCRDEDSGDYRFYLDLIAAWWRLDRSL